jgi:hypothetical protein
MHLDLHVRDLNDVISVVMLLAFVGIVIYILVSKALK